MLKVQLQQCMPVTYNRQTLEHPFHHIYEEMKVI